MYRNKSIGIVVITYNGEKYIIEQLNSILKQSILPDEVMIFDDASTDSTCLKISKFISQKHLNWRLISRESNYGWCRNAYYALKECKTDVIFWSDQDDVWLSDKLKILTDVLLSNQQCLLAYSNRKYIDGRGKELQSRKDYKTVKIKKITKVNIPKEVPPILGCSLCVKRELLEKMPDYVFEHCTYNSTDTILFYCAKAFGEVFYFNKPLLKRRIHENNLTVSKDSFKRKWQYDYKKSLQTYKFLALQLKTICNYIDFYQNFEIGEDKIKFLIYERRYLLARLSYVNCKTALRYVPYALRQCTMMDFVYTIWQDTNFRIRNKKEFSKKMK